MWEYLCLQKIFSFLLWQMREYSFLCNYSSLNTIYLMLKRSGWKGEHTISLTLLAWEVHTLPQLTFTTKVPNNVLILCNFYFAHPADHGEESPVWFCDTKCVLGVCGLPTRIVFGAEGLWGVPITYSKDKIIWKIIKSIPRYSYAAWFKWCTMQILLFFYLLLLYALILYTLVQSPSDHKLCS